MATYYVRTDGNDTNAGTGPATNQAWQTITKAIGATGIAPGDTLYIAPGIYRGSFTAAFTNPANEGQRITISGDPTASQFSGVTAGPIILTNYTSTTSTSGTRTLDIEKPYVTISNIHVNGFVAGSGPNFGRFANIGTNAIILTKCAFYQSTQSTDVTNSVGINMNQGTSGAIIQNCIFNAPVVFGPSTTTTAAYNSNTTVQDCIFQSTSATAQGAVVTLYGGSGGAHLGGIKFYNCSFFGITGIAGLTASNLSTAFPSSAQNCYFESRTGIQMNTNNGQFTESYNVFQCANPRSNVASGTGSATNAFVSLDVSMSRITGWGNYPHYAHHLGTYPINSGLSTGAPAADIYGVTWLAPSTPTMGPIEYFSNQSIGNYLPTERNASTITIAPGSTSQSIELYLGATGLAHNTSGLQAYYIRNRSAPVAITLVTQTATGAWTSGGFAQISSSLTPGVYRLDVPDAAFAAGASDVTIVVRGAAGTNGAVVTVTLSSGGLTSAQTASAVWGASPAGYNDATTFGGVVNQIDATVTGTSTLVQDIPSNVWQEQTDDHTTHGTFGYNILRADAPSKEGLVTLHQSGGISRIDADIHAIVNDTAAAAELKGALLHTGGDYISADLLTPVTSAQTVRIGPFAVRTDTGGADGALDLNQSTAGAVVVQLTDAQGTGIDQTSATVQAKVYNVAGGLVATYTCTPAYAVNGYMSIPMTTAVTGTAGSYIINLWSTVGATVIIYGPLQLRVRAI